MYKPVYQYNYYDPEKEYWKKLAYSYLTKIRELEKKVDDLQGDISQQSNGITIQNLKVNNIQSGAAFNIAEKLYSNTQSDMDMDLGPNSLNVGDSNKMAHHDEKTIE